jgi:hypothetical protein
MAEFWGPGKALDCMYIEYFFPSLVAWGRFYVFFEVAGA